MYITQSEFYCIGNHNTMKLQTCDVVYQKKRKEKKKKACEVSQIWWLYK